MTTHLSPPHVIVIGAGYAGSQAAVSARRAGAQVTVVDTDGLHGFAPRLAAVAAGRAPESDARAPLDDLVDVDVLPGTAAHLDVDRRHLTLRDGTRLSYDAVVVTVGSEATTGPVPGAAEHAHVLKDPDDALALRAAIARSSTVVVAGGGSTGVQLAAEVAAARPHVDVHLVEARSRLLPTEPRVLANSARRLLTSLGVDVRVGTAVEEVDARGVQLADTGRIDGLVVWAGGWEARPGRLLPEASTRNGRLTVAADLTVPGHERVLAAGDVSDHRDLIGRPLAMSAQIASQAGAVAGANAVALAQGRSTRPARLVELGRIVDLGGGRGVARIGPLPLGWGPTRRMVPLLHLAIDLRHLWQLGGLRAVLAHAPGLAEDDPSPRPRLHAVGSP